MDLDQILKVAVRGGASDIVLKTGALPRFRFNGELMPLSDGTEITPEIMQDWIQKILPRHLVKSLESMGDVDFAHQSPQGYRFRVNLFRQRRLFGMILRVVSNHIRTLAELQMPATVGSFAGLKRGLVLVTGATGSGKSTTLAAIIQKINQERSSHIITIEDPIEFYFTDEKSTVNQREIGIDTHSFERALRSALRQNPDVILVGELRDKETTETALQAAETGHLVFSTLHTPDAVESLTRLMSYFPPHQHKSIRIMLSAVLNAVVSQRLVARNNGKGMAAAVEIMVTNGLIRECILKGEHFDPIYQAIRDGGNTYGMQTFDQSLYELWQKGVISREEAIHNASRREDLELRMSGIES